MHIYEKFYREVPKSDGSPARVCLEYPPDFNFGYVMLYDITERKEAQAVPSFSAMRRPGSCWRF